MALGHHIACLAARAALWLAGAAASYVGDLPAARAQTVAAASLVYDIPDGALDPMLRQLADDAGIAITFTAGQTVGKSTAGVHGTLSVDDAFAHLLAGTGLRATRKANGGYVLVPVSADIAQGDAIALPRTDVRADRFDAGITDGAGAYSTLSTTAATGLPLALRDTPQSMTIITRQQIEDQNLLTLAEALRNVVGVAVTTRDSERAYLYARGFTIDNVQFDGVPTALRNSFYGESTADPILYDRIEIVRGATGLLTGAGYPSASVNLVRKRADSKTLAGEAALSWGSGNQRRATVDLSTPVTEDGRIRARVVGMTQSKNASLDFYHSNRQVFYGTVAADLTRSTTLILGYDHQHVKSTGVTWAGLPLVFSDGSATDWRTSATMAAPWTHWITTNETAFLALEHRFDNGWKAKLHFSHRESTFDAKLLLISGNVDRTTGEGLTAMPGYYRGAIQQNSFDMQATGPFRWLGRRHELVVGVSSGELHEIQTTYAQTSPVQGVGNFYQWNGAYAEPTWAAGSTASDDRTRQVGLYGAFRLSLTDRLKIILGARESLWQLDATLGARRHRALTPYTGAIYDVSEDLSLYASYTSIFQPQDYRTVSGQYLSPVTGTSYEFGVKGEHFGGRLNTSLALFRIDQDNVATRDGTNLVAGSTDYAYVGTKGVTSRGIEAQVSGEPVTGWHMTAGIARTLATQANGAPYNTDLPTTQIRLFTAWQLPGDWQALTIGGGFHWQNRVYSTVSTTLAGKVTFVQKPVGTVALMARYAFSPKVSLQLNINNLFDRKYYSYVSVQGTYAERINAMATLTFRL